MILLITVFLWLVCSFFLCLFSFFIGRCARKLPIIDDALPWAMSRSQIPCVTADRPESGARDGPQEGGWLAFTGKSLSRCTGEEAE